MSLSTWHTLTAGEAIPTAALPTLPIAALQADLLAAVADGERVSALFGWRLTPDCVRVVAVLAADAAGRLRVAAADIGSEMPSLTPACPQVHLFEREIAEQTGVVPVGHPWCKPVRFAPIDYPGTAAPADRAAPPVGVMDFFRMDGDEVHEVAVGPVHAGVIEPGHFRFQCHGETVYHLEISLGYQHRGIEKRLVGGPHPRSFHQIQAAAGDTSIGHGLSYCQACEALAGSRVSARAQAIRGIALELERLANHTGDLGALAGDVGFLPTQNYCGAIRGDFLNMTALLCGSRLGRDLLRPGGVAFDLEPTRVDDLRRRLDKADREVTNAVELMFATASVPARFEDTGRVDTALAEAIGLVGPAARASGLPRDVRQDHPSGIYQVQHPPVSVWNSGDVFARATVRWLEIQRSLRFIREVLAGLPPEREDRPAGALAPESLVVTLNEGWRGEICHVAITDSQGHFARYKVVDPSFHNWFGLALALLSQAISDFPLCNKSFNLSYCGFDL